MTTATPCGLLGKAAWLVLMPGGYQMASSLVTYMLDKKSHESAESLASLIPVSKLHTSLEHCSLLQVRMHMKCCQTAREMHPACERFFRTAAWSSNNSSFVSLSAACVSKQQGMEAKQQLRELAWNGRNVSCACLARGKHAAPQFS